MYGLSYNFRSSSCPNFTIAAVKPLHFEPVLKKLANLKIQRVHMSHPFVEETNAILNVYPQVYLDISAIDWAPKEEFIGT